MTDHERQGTSYDPDARGHELAGRDRAPDFKWHTCGSCGQRWGDEARDYERCPVCLTAGARLLEAAREVVVQIADFENMTDEAAAAMRTLRAEILRTKVLATVGVDLASGPDRQVTAYVGSDLGPDAPDRIVGARYEIVSAESDATRLVIRDIGPWDRHPSVTNDAAGVVREFVSMGSLPPDRRLFYYDTDGRLDEIRITDGQFVGFAPGPKGDDA